MESQESSEVLVSAKRRKEHMTIMLIIGFSMLFLTAVVLYSGFRQINHGIHAPSWPTTTGSITSSEVRTSTSRGSSTGTHTTSYEPRISYTYRVGDSLYQGHKLEFIQSGFGHTWSKNKVREYPAGKVVEVSYKPEQPQVSVLEPDYTIGWLISTLGISCIVGPLFIGLSFMCFLYFYRLMSAMPQDNHYRYKKIFSWSSRARFHERELELLP